MSKRLSQLLLALGALSLLGSLLPRIRYDTGQVNLYAHQAAAFLSGRLDIAEELHDVALYGGRYYVPFPPFPAVVLLPFVAVLGITYTKAIPISLGITLLNIAALTRTLKRLELSPQAIRWMAGAFFLGTPYWLAVCLSFNPSYLAHIVAVTGLLLAVHEALGKGRGILVGAYLGMAFLSRQTCMYALVFLVAALLANPALASRRAKALSLLGLMVAVALALGANLAFNWARFGNPLDTGHAHVLGATFLKGRQDAYGLFHPIYLPFNFAYMFLQGFHVDFSGPAQLGRFYMDPFGTSITFASPFVFLAFWARWKRSLSWAAWATVALSLLHTLFYHNNGWVQLNGQRYILDFLPILMILVALGAKRVTESLWKAGIVYAIALNALALFWGPSLSALLSWAMRSF